MRETNKQNLEIQIIANVPFERQIVYLFGENTMGVQHQASMLEMVAACVSMLHCLTCKFSERYGKEKTEMLLNILLLNAQDTLEMGMDEALTAIEKSTKVREKLRHLPGDFVPTGNLPMETAAVVLNAIEEVLKEKSGDRE